MFFNKKKRQEGGLPPVDTKGKRAVLRCSICNGEQVAGFEDEASGKFEEIMLIKSPRDLETFKNTYGVDDIKKEY